MTRRSSDKRSWQSNAYDEAEHDLEEKEAIERDYEPWRDGLSLATFSDIPIGHIISVTASVGLLPCEIRKREPTS